MYNIVEWGLTINLPTMRKMPMMLLSAGSERKSISAVYTPRSYSW